MSTPSLTSSGTDELTSLVRASVGSDWSVQVRDQWAAAHRIGLPLRAQGWKLHVSATVANAADVVASCLPVLVSARCAFKVARDSAVVRELTGPHADRIQAGKVVTVYPADDEVLRDLADQLADATAGLSGPRILTDRPVRPDSVVHYRYGAFTGSARFAGDGRLTAALRAPDGSVVADRREAGFTPPPWAIDPLATAPRRGTGSGLLAERYRIVGALRHAARGGVFRAVDTRTVTDVVIKQARSHIAEYEAGEDTRTRLRREAEILQDLADVDGLPRLVEVFEQQGDLFLVESDLGGVNLRNWIQQAGSGRVDAVLGMLTALTGTVRDLHARGVVLRDLGPNNVVVDSDDGRYLGLVDLETALRPGDDPARGQGATPGYAAPELAGDPTTAVDIYSLAATIAFAFTREHPGVDPWLPTLTDWLDVGGRWLRLPVGLVATMRRMASTDPALRPTAAEVVAALRATTPVVPAGHRSVSAAMARSHSGLTGVELDDAIVRLSDLVLDEVDVTDPAHAVASSSVGRSTAPTNIHHGSGGVMLALSRLARSGAVRDPERHDRVCTTLDALLTWTIRRAQALPDGGPVGLSFGVGGTAHAVAAAADVLERSEGLRWAVDHALSVDPLPHVPDVTHGAAGLGLAMLDLWDRTGDDRIAARIHHLVDVLAGSVVRDERGIGWEAGAPPTRALGFAHGLAGITQFLLGVDNRFEQPAHGSLTEEAVATLVRSAVVVDGCARWGIDLSDRPVTQAWWCHGTAGVVVPLLAASGASGVPDSLLRASARTLVVDRWQHGISYCHGLTGSAEALLDLDAALPGEGWRGRAAELLAMVWARRHQSSDGLSLGDRGVGSVVDFGVGHAGVLSVLLRLRDGGPRVLGAVSEVPR